MSERKCVYCGDREPEDGCDECDGFYYGMRLYPEQWEADMKARGIIVQYRGGCSIASDGEGNVAILCRNPYAPTFPSPPERKEDEP